MASYPNAAVSIAELDPSVTEIAEQRLLVDTQDMRIHHADARMVLTREEDASYDVIIADAFHDIAIPPHLVTLEMAELVSRKLTDNGLYVLNIVDAFPNAKLVKAVTKTLGKVFPEVSIYLDKVPACQSFGREAQQNIPFLINFVHHARLRLGRGDDFIGLYAAVTVRLIQDRRIRHIGDIVKTEDKLSHIATDTVEIHSDS